MKFSLILTRIWGAQEDAQKYYCIAKRCFVKRMRRAGRPTTVVFRNIKYVQENLAADDEFESIINVDFLCELEKNVR